MNLQRFDFSLVRYVPDPARDEAVNLGVIVVAPDLATSDGAFLKHFITKVHSLDSQANVSYIRGYIEAFEARLGPAYQPSLGDGSDEHVRSLTDLERLAAVMRGQFQVTPPKAYRSESLNTAVTELYADLVSPTRRAPQAHAGMSLAQLKRVIKSAIKEWTGPGVTVSESDLVKANQASHFADFWFKNGHTLAALIAIPASPDERSYAWAVRDSVPTIAAEFQRIYPSFKAVAVFPPMASAEVTPFVQETVEFLRNRDGVIFVHADELERIRSQILPSWFVNPEPSREYGSDLRPPVV